MSIFDQKIPWDMACLYKTPEYELTNIRQSHDARALFLESDAWNGKRTKAFGWYQLPHGATKEHKVPAVVLVHGGLGTAFPSWVGYWTKRGYAAIAMDTCGGMAPQEETDVRGKRQWERHPFSGPAGWGNFNDSELDLREQWMYHAAGIVIRSHSFLRSLPEVDAGNIFLTGVSWGGVISCICGAIDQRFRGVAPVYGCGYLNGRHGLIDERTDRRKLLQWLELWDPCHYLGYAKCPFLWLAVTNDEAFSLEAVMSSAKQKPGDNYYALRREMEHGHGKVSEEVYDIGQFFDTLCSGCKYPSLQIRDMGEHVGLDYRSGPGEISKIELLYTRATGYSEDRRWNVEQVKIEPGKGIAVKKTPQYATRLFFNVYTAAGGVHSTEMISGHLY